MAYLVYCDFDMQPIAWRPDVLFVNREITNWWDLPGVLDAATQRSVVKKSPIGDVACSFDEFKARMRGVNNAESMFMYWLLSRVDLVVVQSNRAYVMPEVVVANSVGTPTMMITDCYALHPTVSSLFTLKVAEEREALVRAILSYCPLVGTPVAAPSGE